MELLERVDELATLAAVRDAAKLGAGSMVLVSGEPGIGKTALVTAFVRTLGDGARVLWGTCDDLGIPRPLGPLRDLVGGASADLARALAGGAGPHEIQSLLLAELERPPAPTVLVLEDVHWADEATLDVVAFVGRRIERVPALVVLTLRAGEAPPGHPLHAALAAPRAGRLVFLELEPLSLAAVTSLAGEHAAAVYSLTGGNPFYVTELVAAPGSELPPSVATAVLARASRLDEAARNLVELVSVVPSRVSTSVLDATMPGWPTLAEEPERRHLLQVEPAYVSFRHELARAAIRSSVPVVRRRALHARILFALLASDADPAEIVHHAEAAGEEDVVARYAPVAARRAAALESNREAYSHFRRAADFAERHPLPERAALFEELAHAAYTVGRLEDAFPAIERAIALFGESGDRAAVGRCTRALSRFYWYAEEGGVARERARAAVEILEPLGASSELARAYSGLSQLAMLADEVDEALDWGDRALSLAAEVGDESIRAHALVNVGSARLLLDPGETEALLEAHDVAHAAGDRHEATRALLNLGFLDMCWARPGPAALHAGRALAYAREHEVETLAPYAALTLGWLQLRAGDWEPAERAALEEIAGTGTVAGLLARTVLAELAVRRGDPNAPARLAELAAEADRTGELQRLLPVLELETELDLLRGSPIPEERFRRLFDRVPSSSRSKGWSVVRAAAWAAVAGLRFEVDGPAPGPYAAMLRGDWAGAAGAFGEIGWTYDRALLLSLLDDEQSLREALSIARELGARPLARRAGARMRELGMRVPRGPSRPARSNPAGLTARQLEVLTLLADGLTNAEIAERLVVSPRTAEHHVTAILGKLEVATRRDAARRAAELGLVDGVRRP